MSETISTVQVTIEFVGPYVSYDVADKTGALELNEAYQDAVQRILDQSTSLGQSFIMVDTVEPDSPLTELDCPGSVLVDVVLDIDSEEDAQWDTLLSDFLGWMNEFNMQVGGIFVSLIPNVG